MLSSRSAILSWRTPTLVLRAGPGENEAVGVLAGLDHAIDTYLQIPVALRRDRIDLEDFPTTAGHCCNRARNLRVEKRPIDRYLSVAGIRLAEFFSASTRVRWRRFGSDID